MGRPRQARTHPTHTTHTATPLAPSSMSHTQQQKRKAPTTPPPVPKKVKLWSESDLEEARQENARIAALQKHLKAVWDSRPYFSNDFKLAEFLEKDGGDTSHPQLCFRWLKRLLETKEYNKSFASLFIDILYEISEKELVLPQTVEFLVKELYWEFKRVAPYYAFDPEEKILADGIYTVLTDTSIEKICPKIRILAADIFRYVRNPVYELEFCYGMSMSDIKNILD